MKKTKGLYIHIPFCVQKCKYCDFVSFCDKESEYDLYLEKLFEEMHEYRNERIDSIFIGGGTPTILSASQLSQLLHEISDCFDISNNCEYTIESNPKTLDTDKLSILKSGGVNRISIGIQSFDDSELQKIGRIHNAVSAFNTVELIKDFGFDNINLDLMLSLPGQTEESLLNTLNTAIGLNPTHLSCYSLILEEGTPLYNEYKAGKYIPYDEDKDRYLYHITNDFLSSHGYERYEISNFSKPGYNCRHNLKYWNCEEYIGLGIAAHSYLDGKRSFNTSDLKEYLDGNFHSDDVILLSEKDKIDEYIMMRLRLSKGICDNEFYTLFGKYFSRQYADIIDKLTGLNLMSEYNGSYFLTDKGTDISNSVICEFL